ncbi:aminodeoxychorismate synthase component I [Paramaledivibacter caminithermalis]|jgi:para-aminobenzoate synthetase component 1|uniref:aminodeoxychorismate synthase n=1 Tax=Paramaledivibacter caminithermalis (strain DSM 15212 / CIP 107654 / DViRD3) TaxID=1121301 RepID=A0A1M6NQ43_PARC5|nr:aminodeoxychorismate synthase component I [Paramaledivibacter caminithermalis]SHJ97829.1 aminodeoxychorismate synthase, subunit I [Paramaledivibacter caminithermalis DSM 15212]
MNGVLIEEIKTKLSSFEIYSLFKDFSYSFFLDSGMDHEKLGKYSFIGFDPFIVFKSKNQDINIIENGEVKNVKGNPLLKLKELLLKYDMEYKSEFPFVGGAVGYLSYDLCHQVEKLPRTAVDDVNIPDCFLGFYDGIIIIDHRRNKVFVASIGIKDEARKVISSMIKTIKAGEDKKININIDHKENKKVFKSNFTKKDYVKAIEKVKSYIEAGDIYQANLTQRFECQLDISPYELYGKLRTINPAPFASFIDFGEGYIVSSSPERFIKINDRIIETRPIKGTRPRGNSPQEDRKNREDLMSSEKDKAELLMIVDLERNDLGRISETGTVKVTELFHLEEYPTVYHLVSTVIGKMKDECDVIDVIKATFPGGSITGAPKVRAMEIIDELEPTQRNIYTGSIGYIGFNGEVDLNIVIRTIVCKGDKAYFQVGGGIVWDSDPEMEYEETLHKAKALMKALRL